MGLANSWSSWALPSLSDCEDNPQKPDGCTFGEEFTSDQSSWVGSMYNLGQVFSLPLVGLVMTFVSRKMAVLATALAFFCGWTFIALAEPLDLQEFYWFYIGRFLSGELS